MKDEVKDGGKIYQVGKKEISVAQNGGHLPIKLCDPKAWRWRWWRRWR